MSLIFEQIAHANSMFRNPAPTRSGSSLAQYMAGNVGSALLSLADDPAPQMFQPKENTTGSVIKFLGELPKDVSPEERAAFSKVLKDQEFYLQSGLGMVTAWLSGNHKNPEDWSDHTIWQDPLSALTEMFYTTTDVDAYTFDQTIQGVELSTSFLNSMIKWAAATAIAPEFSTFLETLGEQIHAGIKDQKKTMKTYHLNFTYQPMKNPAGGWNVEATADYYFIDFTTKEKEVFTNCASYEKFDFHFNYLRGRKLLNWAALDSTVNQEARLAWNDAIGGAAKDDVDKAKNFFGKKVAQK